MDELSALALLPIIAPTLLSGLGVLLKASIWTSLRWFVVKFIGGILGYILIDVFYRTILPMIFNWRLGSLISFIMLAWFLRDYFKDIFVFLTGFALDFVNDYVFSILSPETTQFIGQKITEIYKYRTIFECYVDFEFLQRLFEVTYNVLFAILLLKIAKGFFNMFVFVINQVGGSVPQPKK
ncbi:hypothetical protein AGMMS49959_15330 [Planctomycetales bacterium]|nr:hypothetical protein AGMMS49959_15330 [Planctomycetales bacterium]